MVALQRPDTAEVVVWGTKELVGGVRALEIAVRGVLPGDRDAAVQLDHFGRHLAERIATMDLRGRCVVRVCR
jgi:hypothetical protein